MAALTALPLKSPCRQPHRTRRARRSRSYTALRSATGRRPTTLRLPPLPWLRTPCPILVRTFALDIRIA
ncbi:hypothetical protein GCM10027440_13320 [Nocardiopsis coralliicola]